MSELAKKSREAMKEKAQRRAEPHKGDVDASGWKEPINVTEAQTGARPVSKRAFKDGGTVHGEHAKHHAGHKPRKAGGHVSAMINRNVKEANAELGAPHIGGMKKGGMAHKASGGPLSGQLYDTNLAAKRKHGGKAEHMDEKEDEALIKKMVKPEARRKHGGKTDIATEAGTRPTGDRVARKHGGKAGSGKMNVNIVIAGKHPDSATGGPNPMQGAPSRPPAMPVPVPPMQGGMPPGLNPGQPSPMPAGGMPMPPPGPGPMPRKAGGRAYPIKDGSGGGEGRRQKAEAYGLKPC